MRGLQLQLGVCSNTTAFTEYIVYQLMGAHCRALHKRSSPSCSVATVYCQNCKYYCITSAYVRRADTIVVESAALCMHDVEYIVCLGGKLKPISYSPLVLVHI
jgi:hypothetical protein